MWRQALYQQQAERARQASPRAPHLLVPELLPASAPTPSSLGLLMEARLALTQEAGVGVAASSAASPLSSPPFFVFRRYAAVLLICKRVNLGSM